MNTPTPRTDYEEQRLDAWQDGDRFVKSSFARTIETELTAALARNVELEGIIGKFMRHPDNREIVDFMQRVESLTRQLTESQAQLEKQRLILVANQKIMDGAGDSIRALQAQLASIQEEADHYREQFVKANRKCKAVSAQLASAREDSERLDWLSENPIHDVKLSADLRWLQFNGENFVDLRSAIDAARGVSLPPPPTGKEQGE